MRTDAIQFPNSLLRVGSETANPQHPAAASKWKTFSPPLGKTLHGSEKLIGIRNADTLNLRIAPKSNPMGWGAILRGLDEEDVELFALICSD